MGQTFQEHLSAVKKGIREVTVEEVKRLVDQKAAVRVIDVREGEEYVSGCVPGAVSVPRGFLEMRIDEKAKRDEPLVLYCQGGVRSALAAKTLQDLGFTDVRSMTGGYGRWTDRGYPVDRPFTMTREQKERYRRHLAIPEVGVAGQEKLLKAKVLLMGAGGLGSPAALYLAAAGVGTLGLVDMDVVDLSNLQRQVIHTVERAGQPKTASAQAAIAALNPDVKVVPFQQRLVAANVLQVLEGFDLVVDGGDNFPTRYLLNDACVVQKKPNIHGSIFRFEGQVTTFVPGQGPCYRCLYPAPPPADLSPSCAEAGVLGVLPGIIGSIQAMETIKLLLGLGDPLVGRLLAYDALEESFRTFKVPRDPNCAACSIDPADLVIAEYDDLCMPHPIQAPA
jgi:molybdopterin/thiamine biosynthesis adenylyltransferase/rhodanese-related sulfurtransferase